MSSMTTLVAINNIDPYDLSAISRSYCLRLPSIDLTTNYLVYNIGTYTLVELVLLNCEKNKK